MQMRSRRSGFTLVEMMVVLAIIVTLATLVFVGVGKMTFTAHGTVCQNNMHTLAAAVIQYTGFMNGGRLPSFDFGADENTNTYGTLRQADEWVWALGYVDKLYYGHSNTTLVLPPRSSHDILRCPSDTHFVVNAQRALTSYWAPQILSDRVLSRITRRSESPMFFEADPVNLTGNCGCRFHVQRAPTMAETYHDGGSNCAYLDGSVQMIWTEKERTIEANKTPYYMYRVDHRRARYPVFRSTDKWQTTWDDQE